MRNTNIPRINYVEPVVMLATIMQWLFLATIAGAVVGSGTALFLHGLTFFTGKTAVIPLWLQMLLLPLGGFASGLLMHYGYKLNRTTLDDSVIAAIHKQSGRMPFSTLLIKPIAAIITLASGGSAGREGPCSHIGATLASGLGRILRLNADLQKQIVACGVSAGFASVFGTPVAGAIYGVEVLAIGRIRHDFLFPAIVSGAISFETSRLWGIPYTYYHYQFFPAPQPLLFFKIVFIGIFCGIAAWIFVELVTSLRTAFNRIRTRYDVWPPVMPLFGGVLLSLLIVVIPTDYLGLSLPLMNRALDGEEMPYLGFFWKALLVAITLGSGFYGGIATPQLVIGAVSGNALAHLFNISPSFGAAVGLVSVLAAASNTPIAAIIMGVELFGGVTEIVYFAGASIAAYLIVGHRSVYPDQVMAYTKSSWMRARPDLPLMQEKFHLSFGLLKWLLRHQHHSGRRNRLKPPTRR